MAQGDRGGRRQTGMTGSAFVAKRASTQATTNSTWSRALSSSGFPRALQPIRTFARLLRKSANVRSRVGSSSSADQTADVRPYTGRRSAVAGPLIDRFGE